VLHPASKTININSQILDLYLSTILPGITCDGDDANYGSSAMYDVLLLQVCPVPLQPRRPRKCQLLP
jgi:hypothetical protein